MNAKLTQDELQAIKERAEKATSGPWYTEVDGDIYNTGGERIVYDITNGDGASCVVMRMADRVFIEKARQDIPKLVAEVEQLRKAIDEAICALPCGEFRLANRHLCNALGVDEDHYGFFSGGDDD